MFTQPGRASTMDTPTPPGSQPVVRPGAATDTQADWQALLSEMTELHARLEYLRVMLKLGVRSF